MSPLSPAGPADGRRLIGLGERYRLAAVLVPVLSIGAADHFLLERRAAGIRQGGEISFPGGMVDPEDSGSLAAARREAAEELGLAAADIGPAEYLGSLAAPAGLVTDAWATRLAPGAETRLRPNPAEVAETHPDGRVETLLPAKALGLPERYHGDWDGGCQPVWNWPTAHGPLWGVTAEIIREYLARPAPPAGEPPGVRGASPARG
jgi:8-oxo-dGTP pyrophosphatase MutT (NUDIX family)